MKGLFQSEAFYEFLQASGILEPFRFAVSRNGREVGVIQGFIQKDGGCLKQFFSRRAIVNGGPWLAEDITEAELERLLQECKNGLRRKAIYVETRNYSDYSRFKQVFEKERFIYEPHYDFVIETDNREFVDARMGKSRLRDVNASRKQGVSVCDNPTEAEVTAFFQILENLYKTKVKTPLFPKEFFLRLRSSSFSKFIFVKLNDEIIGGTVCVYDEETVYEWFACGKDGVYKGIYPSTVATYYGICFATDNGFRRFDMMGAGAPGDGGYGVREFKAKFGGNQMEYGRFRYVCHPLLYRIGTVAVRWMKHH